MQIFKKYPNSNVVLDKVSPNFKNGAQLLRGPEKEDL